jgi:hypothetical protein
MFCEKAHASTNPGSTPCWCGVVLTSLPVGLSDPVAADGTPPGGRSNLLLVESSICSIVLLGVFNM